MFQTLTTVLILVVLFHARAVDPVQAQERKPLRLGVVGLVHGHVGWILGRPDRGDVELVGIAEPDAALAQRHSERYGYDLGMVYPTTEEMLDAVQPEAVAVFTSIYDHLEVIRACAERGIHVMVEKPLAVDVAQAHAIEALAAEHGIHVLTNFETTWYPTVREAHRLVQEGAIGDIRKMIARDGHEGPKEIGVGPEFLTWLTDPVLNGGGALIDFGCYGANLMTWLMDGQRPSSVLAVTQQLKTDPVYGKVDDEATIVVTYPDAQGIIQASWNWPFSRKDLDVYGTGGAVFADNRTDLRRRIGIGAEEEAIELELPEAPFDDPFAYLAAVVRGDVDPAGGLSSLPVNVIVVEILDAARRSAQSGQAVPLDL